MFEIICQWHFRVIVAHESIATVIDTFYEYSRVPYETFALALLRESIIMIILRKLGTSLIVYIEIERYLIQGQIYISQISQKYLDDLLFIILINLDIQWDHI